MSRPAFPVSPLEEHEYLSPAYLTLNETLKKILHSETIKTTTAIFSIDGQVRENMNEFCLNVSNCSFTHDH